MLDRVTADGRAVLLADEARWEIPPGGTATSDPLTLSVTAGKELVVDLYTGAATDPATYLHSAQRTGEVAPGDQAGAASLTAAEPFVSAFWLARVLVDAQTTGPVVIALGDSITRGDGTSIDLEQRYPDHLQRRLLTAGISGAAVLNAGIGGNRLLTPNAAIRTT